MTTMSSTTRYPLTNAHPVLVEEFIQRVLRGQTLFDRAQGRLFSPSSVEPNFFSPCVREDSSPCATRRTALADRYKRACRHDAGHDVVLHDGCVRASWRSTAHAK